MAAEQPFRRAFLLWLAIGMSIVLLVLLRPFLMTIVVAVVMAVLLRPVFVRLKKRLGGREVLAASLSVLLTLLVVVVPLVGIGGMVFGQAAEITENVRPIIEKSINSPTYLDQKLRKLPGYDKYLQPYRKQILTKTGEAIRSAGAVLMRSLSTTTLSTASLIADFFLALYATFFLLIDGPGMLRKILDHLPLHGDEKNLLKERFMSITRATIKGTLVIGLIQGVMTGAAFWVVGIPSVAFWTVLMVLLSVIPVVGCALIWVPACIVLFAMGAVGKAIGLGLFCALIVGSVDNVLRPWLVGRDTRLHDLVILFSTLGGLVVIGPFGFILGPVLAGLFVATWQIFGIAYQGQPGDNKTTPPTTPTS